MKKYEKLLTLHQVWNKNVPRMSRVTLNDFQDVTDWQDKMLNIKEKSIFYTIHIAGSAEYTLHTCYLMRSEFDGSESRYWRMAKMSKNV